MTKVYGEDDAQEISDLLTGRRIVEAELGSFEYPGRDSWYDPAEGRLVLDDGTVLYLAGNKGGCSCSAGDYDLEKVATVDNIITAVRVHQDPDSDYDHHGEGVYSISVVADAVEINVAEFRGSDGNGYYGTGFSVVVHRPTDE